MTTSDARRLAGRVALVTGCGRKKGIGRGIALALARAGAALAVADVEALGRRNLVEADDPDEAGWKGIESLVAEIEELGGRALPLVGDVGRGADAERMVAQAIAHFGQVDVLVNNAAAPHGLDRGWSWEVPEAAFDEVLRVNTKGVFLMSTALARHLLANKAAGRIINISSSAGRRGLAQRAAYSASKFAVIGLTQSMAAELGPHGILVNAICPGLVITPRQASRLAQGGEAGAAAQRLAGPVPRAGTPADIGEVAVFLADPAITYVTGQALNVDGGQMMI